MTAAGLALLAATALAGQEAPAAASVVLVTAELTPGFHHSGSGVVIAPGVVATNAHVLEGSRRLAVHKAGQAWAAALLRLDPARDLALLRVPGLALPPARLAGPAELVEGRPVEAIGFPGGGELRRGGRLTRIWTCLGAPLLQTDAAIAPGSSGGGLFTAEGELLGITTFALPVGPRFHFAIPVVWAQELLAAEPAPAEPATEPLARRFSQAMAGDPANAAAWDGFTRAWTAAAPEDPEAWFARSQALDQRLREQAGRGRADAGTLEEGLRAGRRAVALGPRLARAWNNLGVALDLANDFPAAEDAFRRAVELEPGYGLAWLNLGGVRINRRDWIGAVDALRRGLETIPDDGTGWARLGYAEGMLGRWPEAAAHGRIALRYQPWNPALWKDLLQACRRAGDAAAVREAEARLAELAAR